MRDKLIELLRSVPITDKTYPEYIEALAMTLLANEYSQAPNVERNVAREIFEEIEKFMSPYRYPIIADLKKKYTEEK